MATVLGRPMSKRNDTTVKVDTEAARIAKIAASFKDQSLAEYVSALIMQQAPRDIEEGASQVKGSKAGRGVAAR